jgi:hypothetical protein
MGKMIARQAGIAAFKSTLRAVIPDFARMLESIQADMCQFSGENRGSLQED